MKNPFTVRNAAVAATAWAATELSNSTWIPAPAAAQDTNARVMPLEAAAIPRVTTVVTEAPAASEPLPSSIEPLPSNEHVPAASEVRERAMAERPVQRTAAQPPITIE